LINILLNVHILLDNNDTNGLGFMFIVYYHGPWVIYKATLNLSVVLEASLPVYDIPSQEGAAQSHRH
jgi:hypothetical protein